MPACTSPYFGVESTRACSAACPSSSEFGDESNNRICTLCDENCLTCSGTSVSCTSCRTPFYLDQNLKKCVSGCPGPLWGNNSTRLCEATCTHSNQYGDEQDNRICKDCDPNCLTCLTTATFCTSCQSPKYLESQSDTCVETCPSPFWGNNVTRTCDNVCPGTNQFGDPSDKRVCKTCDLNCKTCILTALTCSSCNSPLYLDSDARKCVLECPGNRWGNNDTRLCADSCSLSSEFGDPADNRICKKCGDNCLTCETTATNCKSCASPLYLEGSVCVEACSAPLFGKLIKYMKTNIWIKFSAKLKIDNHQIY